MVIVPEVTIYFRMNPFVKDFRTQIRTRFAEDSDSMSYSDWIIKNTMLKQKPYSFKGFEFQRQIVDDMHPNLTVIKCSQVGLTEVQLRKFAAFLSRNVAVSGIFTLPNDDMFRRISTTRFAPMVNSEHVFNLGYDKPIRRMDLYQINRSFGYFVGNKESDATSINADILMHDEVDLSDQEMLGLFQSRLQGSDYRITQGFSTPTFEGFGIDASFGASDQHEYMARCSHCNDWNIPEFDLNHVHIPGLPKDLNDLTEIDPDIASRLDLKEAYIRCKSCGRPLDLHDPANRQWIPRYASRRGRGYRVTPFCRPTLTIEYIVDQLLQYKQKDAMRRFYNTVLGKPYNDSNARLTETDIRACMLTPATNNHQGAPITIGIDVGNTCHITMMDITNKTPVVFAFRQVVADNLLDEVKTIMSQYQLLGGCIDRNPQSVLANDVHELTNGLVVPVEYATSPGAQTMVIVKDELDNISHIRANRTNMIDAVATMVRKRRWKFEGYGSYESLVVTHLRDMVRIEKEGEIAIWQKLTGNDHFFHSLGYALFALRVNDAFLYRSDADPRMMFDVPYSTVAIQSEPEIGMKSRRKYAISLGTF